MSTVLTILGILAAAVGALEIRRRIRKKLGLLPRSRSTSSSALPSRPSRPRRQSANSISPSIANPILLGLVILVLIGWLVAAYLLPENKPLNPPQVALPPAAPEQQASLSGILLGPINSEDKPTTKVTPSDVEPTSRPTSTIPSANLVAKPAPLLPEAVKAIAPSKSNLNQVGLMPTQTRTTPVTKPRPKPNLGLLAVATPRPEPPVVDTPKPKPPVVDTPKPKPPVVDTPKPKPPVVDTPNNKIADASPSSPPKEPTTGTILGGKKEFTVHLGSFAERANADKYKTKLAGAGELAFIIETTVDGRVWYRVMSGRFNTKNNADAHGRDLKRRNLTTENGRYLIKSIS